MIRFQADADLNQIVVAALLRRSPGLALSSCSLPLLRTGRTVSASFPCSSAGAWSFEVAVAAAALALGAQLVEDLYLEGVGAGL